MSADAWAVDSLNDRLDAYVAGAQIDPAPEDAALDAMIGRFSAADDTPAPPPGLAEQLWEDLMAHAPAADPIHPILPMPLAPDAAAPSRLTSVARPTGVSSTLAFFATAALVLLTLIAGFVAFGGAMRPQNADERVALIPALDSTPESSPPAGVISDDVVLQTTIEESPPLEGEHWLGMKRIRFAPGAVERSGRQTDTGVGPEVFVVEEGQITVEAEETGWLTRAGADRAAPDPVPPGTAILLEVGDQFYAPSGVGQTRRNDSATPATILWFSFGTVGDANYSAEEPVGVAYDFGFPDKTPERFPAVPAEATVRRLALEPGAEFAIRDLPGLELVYVEAGALDLVYARPETTATPERAFTIRAGSGTPIFGRTPEQALLANRGTEPLVLLMALVVPASASEASPQAP